jgi:membrane-bound lytic murein transglycosylase B
MRAATSSNFAKKSSVYLSGYTSGFFPRFPRLASHLFNLATKLFLRPVLIITIAGFVTTSHDAIAEKQLNKKRAVQSKSSARIKPAKTKTLWPTSRFRGWDYLVERLKDNGINERDLVEIYSDPRMPERTFVPFSVKPREPSSMYEGFKKPQHQQLGLEFLGKYADEFAEMERTLHVPSEVVAAIIVVESGAGRNTGNHLLVYRLSRLATTNAPDNLRENYVAQKKLNHKVVFEDVRRRGRYLERTFLPEIPALITIAKRNKVDVLSMKGSSAGAFGLPQFLPSAFLRFGIDGNKDGIVSLHNEADAIWSAANYLSSFGYRRSIPLQEKRSIIWRYNKSPSYIDAVLHLAERIKQAR